MKYLKNIWLRIIASLFVGAFSSELIHIMTGDPNRPRETSSLTILCAIIVFVVFTLAIRKK